MKTFLFFGIRISVTTDEELRNIILNCDLSEPSYICFPDTYVIALSQRDTFLKEILNNSKYTVPDGKPIALMGRRKGFKGINTVSGYWVCKKLLDSSLSHYFLGSTQEKINRIKVNIKTHHPKAIVKGFSSPRLLTNKETRDGKQLKNEFAKINILKPDLVWIGISSPKQDFIISNHVSMLNHGLLLGIGGVFDYLSGDVIKSPEWIKIIGLRWIWRLIHEPFRLFSKYYFVIKNMFFKYLIEYIKG